MADSERTEDPDQLTLDATCVVKLAAAIRPMLAGQTPPVVGACLANLTATYLAGHFDNDPERTALAREQLLAIHIVAIRAMIPAEEGRILEHVRKQAQ